MAEPAKKISEKDVPQEPEKEVVEPVAEEVEAREVPERIRPIGQNRFGLAAEKRNHFVVFCDRKIQPEDVLKVEFWQHLARFLNRLDIVEVVPEDCAWEMTVRVIDRGTNWAHVKQRHFVDYGGAMQVERELPGKYEIKFNGPVERFVVYFNGEILKPGFATEMLANRYAQNHADALKK